MSHKKIHYYPLGETFVKCVAAIMGKAARDHIENVKKNNLHKEHRSCRICHPKE